MICSKCKAEMIIDEWEGWIWICINCGHEGREATNEEIQEYEEENT